MTTHLSPFNDAQKPDVPLVSVIVVNYNGRSYLKTCLDSLLATVGQEVELLLIDNQSSDDSVDFVQRNYPQVRLIQNRENSGYAGGNNLGVRYAQGDYLVILNPDTAVQPNWLQPLIAPLQYNPRIGITTPTLLLMDNPERLNTAGNAMHLSGLTLCRGMGQPKELYEKTAVVSAASGAAFAIRRSLFEALGGFDSRFFMYMEDTDLSLRTQLMGFTILHVPESAVLHDYVLKFGRHKTYFQERNRYLMLLKNARWATLLWLLPSLLLAEIITWGFILLKDRSNWRNKLSAYSYLIRNWQPIMKARRQSQAQRQMPDSAWLQHTSSRLAFEQAADGVVVTLAHWLLDPLFGFWRRVILQVVA